MSLRVGPLNKNHFLPVAKETRQVGSELAKVNGLTAKAEVSLHELSSSTDIEKVGFWGWFVGLGPKVGVEGDEGGFGGGHGFLGDFWRNNDKRLGC